MLKESVFDFNRNKTPQQEQESFRSRNAQRYLRYLSIKSANNEDHRDDLRTN